MEKEQKSKQKGLPTPTELVCIPSEDLEKAIASELGNEITEELEKELEERLRQRDIRNNT